MIKDSLKPTKITDIIFRIDDYLENMRTHSQDALEFIDLLTKYITDYFKSSEIDLAQPVTISLVSSELEPRPINIFKS